MQTTIRPCTGLLSTVLLSAVLLSGVLLAGCPEDTPDPTWLDGGGDGLDRDGPAGDGGVCQGQWQLPDVKGNNPSCKPSPTDYKPNDANDGWQPCISDNNTYNQFQTTISSIARVAAFETITGLLLTSDPPTTQDFIDAKVAYTQPEGLDSRVSRREDEHYPAASKKCADMSAAEIQAHQDRCVGQAQIQPLLNQAFADGAAGKQPLLNAARVESALLWFLYVSTYKEGITCTRKKKDCDSSYAYYTGGEPRSGGKGLARYVRQVSTQAHDRTFDGILAVRCWRDLDSADTATDLTLRDRAMAQLDRALLRGLAVLVRSRIKATQSASCAGTRAALWASVQILGNVLDREATERDAAKAQLVRDELARASAAEADLTGLSATLQELFPCP